MKYPDVIVNHNVNNRWIKFRINFNDFNDFKNILKLKTALCSAVFSLSIIILQGLRMQMLHAFHLLKHESKMY